MGPKQCCYRKWRLILITPRYPDKKRGYQLKSYLRLMTENFAQLFEESLQELETRPGSIVKGTVVSIDKDIVLVDAGLKSESAIPADQFKNAEGELEIAIGDQVDVALDAVEDGFGETILSREKAKRHEAWVELEKKKRKKRKPKKTKYKKAN